MPEPFLAHSPTHDPRRRANHAHDAAVPTNGENAVGPQPYGRFRPSVQCGSGSIISVDGHILGQGGPAAGVILIDAPRAAA